MKPSEASVTRCPWAKNALNIPYHDQEWGVPLHDDQKLFELLILEGAQAGFSWDTVLQKRARYRDVFDGFDPEQLARYHTQKVLQLPAYPGLIRHRPTIASTLN